MNSFLSCSARDHVPSLQTTSPRPSTPVSAGQNNSAADDQGTLFGLAGSECDSGSSHAVVLDHGDGDSGETPLPSCGVREVFELQSLSLFALQFSILLRRLG
jgi:hypothetical protein